MPNKIKFSTSSVSGSLSKGNAKVVAGGIIAGPTHVTGFYNGITPPVNGYTFYMKKEGFVEDGLVLFLDAGNKSSYRDDLSSTEWWDLSGYGNDGALINGAIYNSGNTGYIELDGDNDKITTSVTPLYNTDFTISFWAYSDGTVTVWPTIWTQQGTNSQQFATCNAASRLLSFWWSSGAFNGTTSIPYNTMHNGVVQYRHSDGYIKFYLNGQSDSDWQGPIVKYTVPNTLQKIGSWSTVQNLSGGISIVYVYDRVLTSAEVLQNYNYAKSRYGL